MNKEELVRLLKENAIISPVRQYNTKGLNKLCELINTEEDWNLYLEVWNKYKNVYNISYISKLFENELKLHKKDKEYDTVVAYCLGIPIEITLRDGMTKEEFYKLLG